MWTKQSQAEAPSGSPAQRSELLSGTPNPSRTSNPAGSSIPAGASNATATMRPNIPTARNLACLGAGLEVKGKITGEEDLQIDGKVTGNLRSRDRVEIKKDGSVIGDITTALISIEDGAYFKGRIEIDRSKPQAAAESASVGEPVAVGAN
jgi:cytoskeletal protein CcmA (bactofilin family)